MVQLHREAKPKLYQVHPLVAHNFVGPRPPGLVVNHLNGCKRKNWASNLEYITSLENTRHAMRIGTYRPGTYQSKLDEEDVANIRELLAMGLFTTEISSLYCIDASAISRIKNGKNKTRPRSPVQEANKRGGKHPLSKLTDEDVIEIRRLRPTWGLALLAQRYGVSTSVISSAARGETWSHLPGALGKQKGGGPRRAVPSL